jgi:hypothetical protein
MSCIWRRACATKTINFNTTRRLIAQKRTHTGQQGRKRTHLILGTQHDGLGDRAERLHQLNQVGLRRTDDKEKHRLSARAVKKRNLSFRKTRIAPAGTEPRKTKVRNLSPLSHLGDLVADVPDVDHLGRLRHPPELETTPSDHY